MFCSLSLLSVNFLQISHNQYHTFKKTKFIAEDRKTRIYTCIDLTPPLGNKKSFGAARFSDFLNLIGRNMYISYWKKYVCSAGRDTGFLIARFLIAVGGGVIYIYIYVYMSDTRKG